MCQNSRINGTASLQSHTAWTVTGVIKAGSISFYIKHYHARGRGTAPWCPGPRRNGWAVRNTASSGRPGLPSPWDGEEGRVSMGHGVARSDPIRSVLNNIITDAVTPHWCSLNTRRSRSCIHTYARDILAIFVYMGKGVDWGGFVLFRHNRTNV